MKDASSSGDLIRSGEPRARGQRPPAPGFLVGKRSSCDGARTRWRRRQRVGGDGGDGERGLGAEHLRWACVRPRHPGATCCGFTQRVCLPRW